MGSFVVRRRSEIIHLLEQRGVISVAELTKLFGVSSLTIRRDLDALVEEGIIVRSYGNARLTHRYAANSGFERDRIKKAIAKRAAQLIEDGDIVFINTGTTALGIIEQVEASEVTFVTNNGRALELALPASSTVILTGGEIRIPKWSMTGDFAVANLTHVKANKCFLNCSGLSVERGLTTNIAQEMRINALMLENSEKHFVVADSSKVGFNSSFSYGEVANVHELITDSLISDEAAMGLLDAGLASITRVEV